MTKTAPQTSSKAKRESIFRDFMTLTTGKGFSVEIATAAIAADAEPRRQDHRAGDGRP
jgi:hypothetical protein